MRKIVSSTTIWHPSLSEDSREVFSPEACAEGEECRRGEKKSLKCWLISISLRVYAQQSANSGRGYTKGSDAGMP